MSINLLKPKIIFEDEDILVIDKPPGITVNKAETVINHKTIQDWTEEKLRTQLEHGTGTDFFLRGGIVHRLDKETSGLLIIAKNSISFQKLQTQFKARSVKKNYLVLVHGIMETKKGTINAPIGRLPWNRERFGVVPGGREATTDYEVVDVYSDEKEKYSLIKATPHTGRTHQIRVHFKYTNHPVVSDALYTGRKTGRSDRSFCPRQFLHAESLEISHPKDGKSLTFYSPLPEDLKKVLHSLTKISQ